MTGDDRVRLSGSPDGVPRINDWNRLLDGWLFSPREDRFFNRSRNL
jgi:hypothetical protein